MKHPGRPHRWVVVAVVHKPGEDVTHAQEWCMRNDCEATRVRRRMGVRTLPELRDR